MEERIIIEGKIDSNNISKIILLIGLGTFVFSLLYCWIRFTTGEYYENFGYGYGAMMTYNAEGSSYSYFKLLTSALCFRREILVGIFFYLGLVILLIGVFMYFMMSKCSITVTDKRVIGKANFGNRVDLPLNQISAVAQGAFSSISVATSSGRIHFWSLKNRNEVFDELSNILRSFQNQNNNDSDSEKTVIQQSSSADELKKFKDLLDTGVITQEEFDAKKKQLLGL